MMEKKCFMVFWNGGSNVIFAENFQQFQLLYALQYLHNKALDHVGTIYSQKVLLKKNLVGFTNIYIISGTVYN